MRKFIVPACLLVLLICAACSGGGGGTASTAVPDAPVGDASRGAILFKQMNNGAPACATCHTIDGSTLVGPSLKGVSAVAGTRVAGMSAEDYVRTSIKNPSAYVVSGFPNVMYAQFAQQLTPQQIEDLVAYVLTL